MIVKNSIKHLYLLHFFLFCFSLGLEAEVDLRLTEQRADSSYSKVRPIAAESLQELREDGDMDYHLASPEDNLLLQLRNWLFLQFLRLFGTADAAGVFEVIIYIVCLLALAYALLRLLNVDLSGLFSSRNHRTIAEGENAEGEENIHEIDFQAAIAQALKAGEYNKAVRLLYLSALKELAEQGLIHWQPGKTNFQYQQELQASQLQDPFRRLGHLFEFAWYGNFPMNERQYQQAESMYQSLTKNLKGGA